MTSPVVPTSSVSALRPEARLLLVLASPRWTPEIDAAARKLIADHDDLDWAYLFDQALRQQVLSLVGRNITHHRLWQLPTDHYRIPHPWVYSAAYEANTRRNRSLFTEFARIFRALDRSGVRYAVRKGPVLCANVYDDPGIRRMSDLDVLIERDSLPQAAKVLIDLGYAQGTLSMEGTRVIPYERSTELFWGMHLNNALPFKKPTTDPEVDVFDVDLCLDLFQRRSAGSVDIGLVLERAVPQLICGTESYALSPLDHLMDVCLHLYKEACSYLSIERGRDINLMRFLDVAESVRVSSHELLDQLVDHATELNGVRELYFALHYAAILYADSIPSDLLDRLAPADLSYLDAYGTLEDKPGQWRQGFLDRLFNPHRKLELSGGSTIPYQ
jgi:hypothetical protein